MQQLIQQITEKFNLSEDDATGIVDTVKNYLAANAAGETTTQQPVTAAGVSTVQGDAKEESILEKAEDFVKNHIPGGLKEKAEEMFNGVGDKLKGMFK